MAEVTGLRNNVTPYPLYGLPWGIEVPLLDADGDPISPSSQDTEISKNGDTAADCTNEIVEISGMTGVGYLLLTGTEMTTNVAAIQFKSTGAKTTIATLYPQIPIPIRSGTVGANAADGTTLQLDSSAVAIDDYYNGCIIAGTLDSNVEVRMITDYVGSTKVCSVTPNFVTTPDNNDTFVVYLPPMTRQVMQADPVGWNGTAVASPHTAGYPVVTIKDGTGTGEIDTTSGGVLVAAIAANAITATAINADAITAAKVAADVTTEIQSGLATAAELAKVPKSDSNVTWNATAAAQLQSEAADALNAYDPPTNAEMEARTIVAANYATAAALTTVDGIVDDILLDTAEIGAAGAGLTNINLPNQTMDIVGNITGNLSGSVGSVTGAVGSVTGLTAADVGAIKAKTDNLPSDPADASVIAGLIDALPTAAENADAVWDEAQSGHITAGTFGAAAQVIRDNTAAAGAAGAITLDAGADANDDFYNGNLIVLIDGTGVGQARFITDYNGTTKVASVSPNWVTQPLIATRFVIVPFASIPGASAPTAAEVADAVWDEDATGHQTGGTFGQAIGDPAADTNTIYGAVVTGAAGATVAADIIAVKSETAAIVADTNELQTDWANGGRLDNILDARASQTSVDDLPTNAELATSQAAADDATLAAIAGLNNLSAAQVNAEVDTALADYDGPTHAEMTAELATADDAVLAQVALVKAKTDNLPSDPADASVIAGRFDTLDTSVADVPTNSELATALGTADDATLAAIAALNNLSSAQAQTAAAAALTAYDPPTRTEATSDKDEVLAAVGDVPTNAELATALAGADDATLAQIALVKAKTDLIPASPAAVGDTMTLTSGERVAVADALLDRNMASGTDSGSDTVRTPRQALRFNRNKWEIAGGVLSVKKEDDSTESWRASVTATPGNPLISVDPDGP